MKILLAGHEGCYNRGCEAIIFSTQLMLRQGFNDPKFILSSFEYTDDARQDWGGDTRVIPARSSQLWQKYSFDWFLAKFYRRISKDKEWDLVFKPLLPEISQCDVVLSVGGDNYTDDYIESHDPLRYYLQLNRFVKKHGKKLVIWGASIGPFKKKERLQYVTDCLNLADLLTIRESKSFEYLKGIGVKNIRRVCDPAFLLPKEEVNDSIVGEMKSNSFLGFNISPIIARRLTSRGKDYLIRESAKFLDGILKNGNFKVVLIPHVNKNDGSNNDRIFMEQVKECMSVKSGCYLPSQDYNCRQLKFLISQCKFFIGARTHSTIAALSSGVPTLSIGYSQKAVGINEDIFGHHNYLIDTQDLSADNLKEKLDLMIGDETKIRNHLQNVLPDIQKGSWDNLAYLKELCNGK